MRRSDGEAGLDGEKNGMCRILCEFLHGYLEKHSRCDVNCQEISVKTIHSLTVNIPFTGVISTVGGYDD